MKFVKNCTKYETCEKLYDFKNRFLGLIIDAKFCFNASKLLISGNNRQIDGLTTQQVLTEKSIRFSAKQLKTVKLVKVFSSRG